jgi:hypothetical protein
MGIRKEARGEWKGLNKTKEDIIIEGKGQGNRKI